MSMFLFVVYRNFPDIAMSGIKRKKKKKKKKSLCVKIPKSTIEDIVCDSDIKKIRYLESTVTKYEYISLIRGT